MPVTVKLDECNANRPTVKVSAAEFDHCTISAIQSSMSGVVKAAAVPAEVYSLRRGPADAQLGSVGT